MISVQEALELIKTATRDHGIEKLPLSKSIGRTLKEDWYTDRELPPYDRVSLDGIAINYSSFTTGQKEFRIDDIAPAGLAQVSLTDPALCIEVMTGSILPIGCDTVIRYEDVSIEDGMALIMIEDIKPKQNVHFKGSDLAKQSLIVKRNTVLSSAEIGIGASIGKSECIVAKLPKVIIVSTGDELVPITSDPLPHQIRRSNVHQLHAALNQKNVLTDTDHLSDDKDIIREKLKEYLHNYDAIILSGGVSKGKFDFLPEVLADLKVEKLFHKIKQRPGKPFWFGQYKNQCTIFALPGNPISSFLCLHKYFFYWLHCCLTGNIPESTMAILNDDVIFKKDLDYFLEVKLNHNTNGQLLATPIKGNGSGDLSNLVKADAFIELPKNVTMFNKGQAYPILRYRNML